MATRSAAERVMGSVRVDGEVRPKSYRLEGGETIEFAVPDTSVGLTPEPVPIGVVYEDEHLLVVDKPAGMPTHPDATHRTGTLVHALLDRGIAGGDDPERPGIVHRLDRETSGLLVVARSQGAHARLQELVRERAVEREYAALVRGKPQSRRGRIEAAIGRDRNDPTRVSLDTDVPREAVTHFEVAELLPRHTLLRVRLATGRTHQIRVHLAAIELPVSGDPLYGIGGDLGLTRQFLHAARLAFAHPVTGERVDVEAPLPRELQSALERARLAS